MEPTENEEVYETLCGVILIGAPGTGKTTLCTSLNQFLTQLDRKHAIVNLDPANDNMEYKVKDIKNYFVVVHNRHP